MPTRSMRPAPAERSAVTCENAAGGPLGGRQRRSQASQSRHQLLKLTAPPLASVAVITKLVAARSAARVAVLPFRDHVM